MKSDVEKFRIVAEHYFGWFRWSNVVARLDLIEIFQHDGVLPDLVIKLAVDRRRLFKARHSNWLALLWRQNNRGLATPAVSFRRVRGSSFRSRRRLGQSGNR